MILHGARLSVVHIDGLKPSFMKVNHAICNREKEGELSQHQVKVQASRDVLY